MTTTTAAVPDIDDRTAKSAILRLAIAQALAGANSTVVMTTGGIVGSMLAPRADLATLPVTTFVIGTALSTLPAGWIARNYGRRASFIAGAVCGVLIGLIAAFAIYIGSFALFCFGTFIGGAYQAVAQSFRFAATDAASPALRPKALSWVMIGGIFSGVLGPQLVNTTMDWAMPYLFLASFLAQSVVALLCMAVLSTIDIPRPVMTTLAVGRPLKEIALQPRFITAAACGMVSYALMNLVMTSAPLAMKMCGLPLSDANWGIQWHVLAMYAPSFFTGSLIARYGAPRVVTVGLAFTVLAAISGLTGITAWHFWIGLILLGIGWNFGFVGASAMVIETHRPEERNKVQSFNDFLVFGFMAIASFSSGQMLANSGWALVNWVVFPPIALALLLLIATGAFKRRERVA
ncbi:MULTISPECIES: MFS transporter [unclassified Beijerinckia]|uniref:MFS transporter n=1 Tax=unclassified Beijerinckia TaxID=2638183 RepID=UPI00089921FD|nr:MULTISPECIES: MFS transporter [unclassified Beijerinckia]MDH7794720.1 MFS family permease [Beijerinckia sp. GAS462]SEB72575.1 Predicted arabinose efflux permease, MFS family [Beijerinckia sp. 28-YEA-48]